MATDAAIVRVSGHTSIVSSRRLPSGNSRKPFTSSGRLVTRSASPPATAMRHTCEEPPRLDAKYTWAPSGDHAGLLSPAGSAVSRFTVEPSTAASHTSVRPRFAARSVSRTENATHLPSGDTAGSPTRCIASMSSMVRPLPGAATAGAAARRSASGAKRKIDMRRA